MKGNLRILEHLKVGGRKVSTPESENVANSLIPTFHPGQKVRIFGGPFEIRCSHCGRFLGTDSISFESVILEECQAGTMTWCPACNGESVVGKGWWKVQRPDYPIWSKPMSYDKAYILFVPWTMLEAIED